MQEHNDEMQMSLKKRMKEMWAAEAPVEGGSWLGGVFDSYVQELFREQASSPADVEPETNLLLEDAQAAPEPAPTDEEAASAGVRGSHPCRQQYHNTINLISQGQAQDSGVSHSVSPKRGAPCGPDSERRRQAAVLVLRGARAAARTRGSR